jgi:hypothetical protein
VIKVEVQVQAMIECRNNGVVITCPTSTLDGYANASTWAAIGKASLIIEDQQNWAEE